MTRPILATALATLFALSGCASLAERNAEFRADQAERKDAAAAKEQAERERYIAMMPTCDGEDDCRLKWEAAELWIADNAGMAMHTQTNVVLATFASNPSTRISARATKRPIGGGEYRIEVWAGCTNFLSIAAGDCDLTESFARYVSAAGG